MTNWRLWQLILLAILLTLLASGLVFLVSTQPHGAPVELEPLPTASPLTISVAGAVQKPGVYSLSPGSRVLNAVEAAGGATSHASLESINLASLLRDGQQVYIPAQNEPVTPLAPIERQGLIDLNQASIEELMTLPGIGETRAQDIITYRQQKGGFSSIDELMNVNGIGQATFEKLKPLVTIAR